MKKYYDVHVFISRQDGFSAFMDTEKDFENDLGNLDEDAVISETVNKGLITDADALQVDYVVEITEKEYKQATGN